MITENLKNVVVLNTLECVMSISNCSDPFNICIKVWQFMSDLLYRIDREVKNQWYCWQQTDRWSSKPKVTKFRYSDILIFSKKYLKNYNDHEK